jgi:sigma-B regulation protein RsbU (phosphoserine phosphatase)
MTAGHEYVVEGFIEALLDDDAEALYDRAPCGYLSTTPDGTIVKVNDTFLTLSGYARDDIVGRKRFAELLSAGGRIYHETHYAPMLRMQAVAREIALELVCADGRRLPILVNSVLERDESGHASIIRTAIFDASHRRRYERELLREKERAEASQARATALARTLQQTLIPPHIPAIDGLDVSAEYRPAGDGSEVGGDFYDIFQASDDDWVVVIGDVCGKGVDAAVGGSRRFAGTWPVVVERGDEPCGRRALLHRGDASVAANRRTLAGHRLQRRPSAPPACPG